MKNQKHDQNSHTTVPEKSSKHDANLQKNSTLYFQIGLILCLLSAYIALEYNFEQYNVSNTVATLDNCEDVKYVSTAFRVEEVINTPKKTKTSVLKEPEIVPDTTPDEAVTKNIVDAPTIEVKAGEKVVQLDPSDIEVPDVEEPIYYHDKVENVPVYPGCEKAKSNKKRIKCMSDKLTKLVQRKFNTDIAADEGLEGIQRIRVQFKILKTGEIQLINLRAPHPALEKEAARITSKIPNMKPGIQNGNAVDVIYNLPIAFDVQ